MSVSRIDHTRRLSGEDIEETKRPRMGGGELSTTGVPLHAMSTPYTLRLQSSIGRKFGRSCPLRWRKQGILRTLGNFKTKPGEPLRDGGVA